MEPRYLLVAGNWSEETARLRQRASRLAAPVGLDVLLETELLLVLGQHDCCVPLGDRGLVLGTIFPRAKGAPRITRFEEKVARGVAASGAATLINSHWGAYVAVTSDPRSGQIHLVRPPFGELACYYARSDGALVTSSDARLVSACTGARPSIDWLQVARHLLAAELRPSETCVSGISELIGGEQLVAGSRDAETRVLWSPWRFIEPRIGADTFAGAAAQLRQIVLDAVGRWARRFNHVLVGISGGLDSSIVATAVHQAEVPMSCVTFVTADPLGDEREFARLIAEACRAPLFEHDRELAGIDLARSNAAHLPRPVGRSFAQESERISLEVARRVGADAIFRGGGGDNVFCYLQSPAPLADHLLTQGPGIGALGTAVDLCRLTGCSLATVLARGVRRAWLRAPRYPWPADISLLTPDVAEGAAAAVQHPWLETPAGALPGKAAHIALILGMQNHMEGLDPQLGMPLLSPLMSQPIVEFCLGVPSWLWCRGGHNRAVARRAFAKELPRAIRDRRGKGTPEAFVIEIFEANRERLLDRLAGGHLQRERIIDLDAVARVLRDPRPVTGHAFSRVVQLADVEAWADSWGARPSGSA